MNSKVTLIFIVLLGLLCQCNSHHDFGDDKSDYPSSETFKSIDSCMSIMNTDPQKAHHMLSASAADYSMMATSATTHTLKKKSVSSHQISLPPMHDILRL